MTRRDAPERSLLSTLEGGLKPMGNENSSMTGWLGVVIPGFCVFALALFGYMRSEPSLRSARQNGAHATKGLPKPASPDGVVGFYARLWEDPLETSYENSAVGAADEKDASQGALKPAVSNSEVRSEAQQQLALRSIKDAFSQILRDATQDTGGKGARKLLCLPVFIPGEPYSDDREDRMRVNVAVLSALSVSGYELAFPTRMTYVDLPIAIRIDELNKTIKRTYRIPLKLFRRSAVSERQNRQPVQTEFDRVLVLWIDESLAQSRPLNVVAQALRQLFEPDAETSARTIPANAANSMLDWKDRLLVHILGPFDSDGLKTLHSELQNEPANGLRPSPNPIVVTARYQPGSLFLAELFPDERVSDEETAALNEQLVSLKLADACCREEIYSARATIPEEELKPLKNAGAPLIARTIGDDRKLAVTLIDELKLRGAWPNAKDKYHKKTVVLITERDTLYGRVFPSIFEESARQWNEALDIRRFSYLRGIDGELPMDRPDRKPPERHFPQPEASPPNPAHEDDPRPTGFMQFDYLRRLERQLVEMNSAEKTANRDGISAIGIVGTDVYDKLLILRALRKSFPNVCFFTTDLDAEFLDPDEIETTRNVIVAAHFGLQLAPELQREIPPFRDSYQTAMFFGALRALKEPVLMAGLKRAKSCDDPWGFKGRFDTARYLSPLVFEIGRDRPFQLTMTSTDEGTGSLNAFVHPPSPRQTIWLNGQRAELLFGALVSIAVCLMIYVTGFRRIAGGDEDARFGRLLGHVFVWGTVVVVVFGVLPAALIMWDHKQPDGEPFSLTDGISIWPPTYIRYVAFLVALYSSYSICRKLKRSDRNLVDQWFAAPAHGKVFGKPVLWRKLSQFKFREALKAFWEDSLTFNWPSIHPGWKPNYKPGEPHAKATGLFRDYVQRGKASVRLARVIPIVLLYLTFSWCLFAAAEPPTNPYRGPVAGGVAFAILISAVVAMLLLVFLVLDATQLFRRLLVALKNAEPDWSSPEVERLYQERGAVFPNERSDVRELVTIRLVAEQSNVVGKLIVYPFLIVFLMILSRNPAFDYMNLGWVLIVQWSIILGAAIFTSYAMRRHADALRQEILARLRGVLPSAIDTNRFERLKLLIEAIRHEDRGAFGPWYADPVLRGLAIPFGGATGVIMLQQVLPSLII